MGRPQGRAYLPETGLYHVGSRMADLTSREDSQLRAWVVTATILSDWSFSSDLPTASGSWLRTRIITFALLSLGRALQIPMCLWCMSSGHPDFKPSIYRETSTCSLTFSQVCQQTQPSEGITIFDKFVIPRRGSKGYLWF